MAKQTAKTEGLNPKQKKFIDEYIFDWNGTRAYQAAFPGSKYMSAAVEANRLLKNPKIIAYLEEVQKNLEKTANISRLMVIREHQKIAFSSIARLHNSWITRREFEDLTDQEKSSISELTTQTRMEMGGIDGEKPIQVDYVKIKLHDKIKSLEAISKMLGYNEPDKMLHEVQNVKSFVIKPVTSGIDKGNKGK
jgi:phage terminase small subunit